MSSNRGPGRRPNRSSTRRPSTQRPASRPRAAGSPQRSARATADGAGRRPAPPHLWRLGALIVLLGFLALFLTPTLRGYLDQRASISRAEQQIAAEQAKIDRIKAELARWEDEDYIEQQARQRLRFVKPGEVAFTVLDDTGEELSEPLPGMAPVTEDVHAHRPWYGQVWESVVSANEGVPEPEDPHTTVVEEPAPATPGEESQTDAPQDDEDSDAQQR